MDKFKVEVISATENPQQVIWAAMHQDYCEDFVYDSKDKFPNEEKAGELIVKHLLSANRGHYGPIEHPVIVFNVGYFPHSMMQQIRTHRVGVSFDVQCLSGNTEITFVNINGETNKKLKKTLAELYDLWTNGEQKIRTKTITNKDGKTITEEYRRDCKKRLQKMNLRVLNEDTGFFEIGHIKEVMCSGIQPIYRVTLEDQTTLDCTVNHRLFTSEGWQTMGDALELITDENNQVISINKECFIMCNGLTVAGNGLYREKDWLKDKINQGFSTIEIANLAEVSPTTIRDWAKKYDLDFNKLDTKFTSGEKPWNYNPNALYLDQEWLETQLNQGLNVQEMADLAECSIETIKKWVYIYGLNLNKRPSGTKNPWNKNNGGYKLNLSPESRKKRIENAKKYTKRGAESNFWKGGTSTERELIGAWTRQIAPQVHEKFNYICQRCGQRGNILHAHHLIPVFADESLAYNFDNLVSLCKDCHQYIHHHNLELDFAKEYQEISESTNWKDKPKSQGRKLKAHPVKVVKVEYLGEELTYDLEVEGPWHNFVANGLVVHNSFRYTGNRIIQVVKGERNIEDVFYLRPVGNYTNRQGKHYFYSEKQRQEDLKWCLEACKLYQKRIEEGLSEEHARGIIPFDARQHFVMSCNARSLMHILDLRWKKDAQLEAQKLCELLYIHFEKWSPALAKWYLESRAQKARLSP
jgi:thymidylate synthase (FAD)